MRNFLQIIVLFFLLLPKPNSLIAQNLKIGIQTGVGTYKMSDLRQFNKEIKNYTEIIGTKITSNYPNYYYFQPAIIVSYKYINFGLILSYQTTGSRVSAIDYSGEYRFDTKINSLNPGLIGEVNLNPNERLKFTLYTEFGRIYSRFRYYEYFRVNEVTMFDNEYFFKSKHYYFEPGIKISYPVYFTYIEFNLGYFIQKGDEVLRDKFNNSLYTVYKDIKPDWSGLRYGVSLYVKFKYN